MSPFHFCHEHEHSHTSSQCLHCRHYIPKIRNGNPMDSDSIWGEPKSVSSQFANKTQILNHLENNEHRTPSHFYFFK